MTEHQSDDHHAGAADSDAGAGRADTPAGRRAAVDESSRESFPASDPPASWSGPPGADPVVRPGGAGVWTPGGADGADEADEAPAEPTPERPQRP